MFSISRFSESSWFVGSLASWFGTEPCGGDTTGVLERFQNCQFRGSFDDFCLVGGLEHFLFSHILGISNHPNWRSYFSEGWPNHQPVMLAAGYYLSQWSSGTFPTGGLDRLERLFQGTPSYLRTKRSSNINWINIPWRIRMYSICGLPFTINIPPMLASIYHTYGSVMGNDGSSDFPYQSPIHCRRDTEIPQLSSMWSRFVLPKRLRPLDPLRSKVIWVFSPMTWRLAPRASMFECWSCWSCWSHHFSRWTMVNSPFFQGGSENRGYPKIMYFHGCVPRNKPSIIGYPHVWNPPYLIV